MTRLPRPLQFALLLLTAVTAAGCGGSDRPVAFGSWTERRTTASLDYNAVARTTEEAQIEVREMCGEAEVLSVSRPTVLENGLFRVTADCLATYDRRGNLIDNVPQS